MAASSPTMNAPALNATIHPETESRASGVQSNFIPAFEGFSLIEEDDQPVPLIAKITDDAAATRSDASDSSDDEDVDLKIPANQSIMDYLASIPDLTEDQRARVLSKVSIEAKRKEIALFVGQKETADMTELEICLKFNQLDNWKFSQVRVMENE